MVRGGKGESSDGTPGVRPIGIGEVLRLLVGKLLIGVIKAICYFMMNASYLLLI